MNIKDKNDELNQNGLSRKSYSDDFKREVAEAANQSGATLASVGEKFNVNPTLVRNWKIQFSATTSETQSDGVSDVFKVNAGWEERDGRVICRWIMVWNDIDGDSFAGVLGGYSGGGTFQMEQFYAKHSGGALTNLMIDIEDKITNEEIDFFDDVPSDVLAVCDDAQDVVMEWHDQDEWEDEEQLILLDERLDELTISDDMHLLAQGTSPYIKNILELAGITAAPL